MNDVLRRIKEEFLTQAVRHGEATESGDFIVANKAFDEIASLTKQLDNLDKKGEVYSSLLNHQNDSVKAFAAYRYLDYSHDKAISVLEQVATGSGLVGFSAKQLLKQIKSDK